MQVMGTEDLTLNQKLTLMLESGLLPKTVDTKAKAFVIMQTGKELGLEPMSSFKNIFVVGGQPVLSSDLKIALIYKRCPTAEIQFVSLTETQCEIFARRNKDLDMVGFTYSIEDAVKAGLFERNKNYEKHPKVMLKNRCVSIMASSLFPDIFMGFSEDNLEDILGGSDGQNNQRQTAIRDVDSTEGGDQEKLKENHEDI